MSTPGFVNQTQTVVQRRAQIVGPYLELQRVGNSPPVTARQLAETCEIGGDVQTQRRKVRDIIHYCRETLGLQVCATTGTHDTEAGYWIARNAIEWEAYKQARRSNAVFEFVAVRRMSRAVADKTSGQQMLDLQPTELVQEG